MDSVDLRCGVVVFRCLLHVKGSSARINGMTKDKNNHETFGKTYLFSGYARLPQNVSHQSLCKKVGVILEVDETRAWGPPYAETESADYLCANRNKRSICLNLKEDRGKEIVKKLVADADVLVENFKTGTMAKMGLSYEDLRKINPRLVYCSITGYGQTGPDKEQPGYDFAVQGRGGIMSITGEVEGSRLKVGVSIVDVTAAMNAAISILAALQERERTGEGQYCDIALLDSQLGWLINRASNYLISGAEPKRYGNGHPNICPYDAMKASDRWFNLTVGNDAQFRHVCEVIGADELASDPRFTMNPDRVENREELL